MDMIYKALSVNILSLGIHHIQLGNQCREALDVPMFGEHLTPESPDLPPLFWEDLRGTNEGTVGSKQEKGIERR